MNQLTIIQPGQTAVSPLETISGAADEAATTAVFADFLLRKSDNTLRTHAAGLSAFSEFLCLAGIDAPGGEELQRDPGAWRGLSWGVVEAFAKWLLNQGYAIATINNRISTVKVYAALAMKAGALAPDELTKIQTVTGYNGTEARRVDERRKQQRRGHKKDAHVSISSDQAAALKQHPDTPQGRRDALLLSLLLDHGLRVGEVARLQVTDFDLKAGRLHFYRPKVDQEQTHKLSSDSLRTAVAYFQNDAPAIGRAFLGSRKDGRLTRRAMTARSITRRVRALGEAVGIAGLSAHDCRHFWATQWAGRVDLFRLQEAGGWSSLAMPRRYTERAAIANEGMV